jgi:putative hemolysin
VLRVFGDSTTFTEARVSPDEIQHMVDEAERSGSVRAGSGEILSRAIDFGSLSAADVMVHRRFVVGLPIDADANRVRDVMLKHKHRRLPVYEKSIDNVLGYLSWRDVMSKVWSAEPVVVRDLMRPVHFVPETLSALSLLQQMQQNRAHMAIALEEHGGMAGIVTLEDLVEELVGEIFSEHDPIEQGATRREPDGAVVVQANMTIRDVNRAFDVDLPDEGDWYTVGGLCTHLADGRIPNKGERFGLPDGTAIEIIDSSQRRVRTVRLRPMPPTVSA